MNLKTLFIAVTSLISTALHAQSPLFRIDSCGIYYKGDTLRHGELIDKWIQVLGEPSRRVPLGGTHSRRNYQWDELGVAISSGFPYFDTDYEGSVLEESEVGIVYFFFHTIHQDPAMRNRYVPSWISDYHPNDREMLDGETKTWQDFGYSAYADSVRNPIHFFEPLNPLQKVELDGMEIHKGTKIEKLNPQRMEIGLTPFRFFGTVRGKYLTEHDRISNTFPSNMGYRVETSCAYWGYAFRLYFDKTKQLICIEIEYSEKIMDNQD